MRRSTPDGTPHKTERGWLRWRALVHLGVALGGAIGLQQVATPTSAAALNDGTAPTKASLARDNPRLPLAERTDNDSDALESSSAQPANASRSPQPSAPRERFVPALYVERFESASPTHAYEARAPPRQA